MNNSISNNASSISSLNSKISTNSSSITSILSSLSSLGSRVSTLESSGSHYWEYIAEGGERITYVTLTKTYSFILFIQYYSNYGYGIYKILNGNETQSGNTITVDHRYSYIMGYI